MSDGIMMACPRCGAEHEDLDGFGFIAHTQPAYADGCGWCSHPSRDGIAVNGMWEWTCGICGDVRRDPVMTPAKSNEEGK